MSTDRLLNTVLRAYQSGHNPDQTNRILSTTTSLLTTLSNPLNITILTSQLLTAPAVWNQPDGLRTCLRIISIFNSAAITVRQHELERSQTSQPQPSGGVSCDDWTRAILKGADDKSPRWRHILVIGGILLGTESQDRQSLSKSLKHTVEVAFVTATNLALEDPRNGALGTGAIVLSLNHTFGLLSDKVRRNLNFNIIAPVSVHALIGDDGYQNAQFLAAMDVDATWTAQKTLDWSQKSPSFIQLQRMVSGPLPSSMGSLSKLIAHSITYMAESRLVSLLLDDLLSFSSALATQWRRNKLSVIDPSEVHTFLTPETARITYPLLWQLLKSAMFAIVAILRSIIGRTLVDPILASDKSAPLLASKTLHILRNIYFVSSRMGLNAFTAINFVFLTSIDILSRFPRHSKAFLTDIQPPSALEIPAHALDRNLDLYFLNTSEHFTLTLTTEDNESLVVAAASRYLKPSPRMGLVEIFEAAHSAMLAVLTAPQNASLAARIVPSYFEALFSSFPTNLLPRQFRFAFKTLLQLTTPPAPLSALHPLLPDTLLELLYHRAKHAPTIRLPPTLVFKSDADAVSKDSTIPISEKSVLMLALLDALPYLSIPSLEEWLPLAADLLNSISNDEMREFCKARFWEVLENGEMDVERAAICVAWWSSRGGRELVLLGRERAQEEGRFMSGGLAAPDGSRL